MPLHWKKSQDFQCHHIFFLFAESFGVHGLFIVTVKTSEDPPTIMDMRRLAAGNTSRPHFLGKQGVNSSFMTIGNSRESYRESVWKSYHIHLHSAFPDATDEYLCI